MVIVVSLTLVIVGASCTSGFLGTDMRVDPGSVGPSGGFAPERLDQASIVVIGHGLGDKLIGFRRTSPQPWSYAVQLSEVRLMVDCVISGEISKGEHHFFQYQWVDSGSGPSTNTVLTEASSIFLLIRDRGRLRSVVDVFPSAIPLPFYQGGCPDQSKRTRCELVADLLFEIKPDTVLRREYDLWDTEYVSSRLVGEEATRQSMRRLLVHPSPTIRDAAAKIIRRGL